MIIIYNDRHSQREYTLFPCFISCENCPFRFKCLTQSEILEVHEYNYRQATTIHEGREYLSITGIGRQITPYLLSNGVHTKWGYKLLGIMKGDTLH